MSAPLRCGDIVSLDKEELVVAFTTDKMLAWAGYPAGMAPLGIFRIVRRCSDEEHRRAVQEWRAAHEADWRRERVLRTYPEAAKLH